MVLRRQSVDVLLVLPGGAFNLPGAPLPRGVAYPPTPLHAAPAVVQRCSHTCCHSWRPATSVGWAT